MYVCMCVCESACMCACMCVCVCLQIRHAIMLRVGLLFPTEMSRTDRAPYWNMMIDLLFGWFE